MYLGTLAYLSTSTGTSVESTFPFFLLVDKLIHILKKTKSNFLTLYFIFSAGSRRKTEDSVGESCVEDINAASTTASSTTQAAREVASTAASVASNVAASNAMVVLAQQIRKLQK